MIRPLPPEILACVKAAGLSYTHIEEPSIKAQAVDIPGLFNIELPDGRRLYDMTIGQVESIAHQNSWAIERV